MKEFDLEGYILFGKDLKNLFKMKLTLGYIKSITIIIIST